MNFFMLLLHGIGAGLGFTILVDSLWKGDLLWIGVGFGVVFLNFLSGLDVAINK